jgi:hypothetical protein
MSTLQKSELRKELSEFIDDKDLESYFGGSVMAKHILKYGEIDDYQSIQKILPRKNDFKIILLESKLNSGHWVALLRYGKTIEYYNSYGLKPSKELDFNSDLVNQQLDQETKHLNILFRKAVKDGFKVIYNRRRFQKMSDDVATCGKHVILRLIMFSEKKMTLPEYILFIDKLSEKLNLTPDLLVTGLVRKHRR